MAIFATTTVEDASQEKFFEVAGMVESAIEAQGAPPVGLMAHAVVPHGSGYLVHEVWRQEDELRAFYENVLYPAMTAAGLSITEPAITPVWSFARP